MFLPGAKSNSRSQCLRDVELDLAPDGSYTLVLSRISDRPKWCTSSNWIVVPDDARRCIVCLRAYCPRPGAAFRAPKVWFNAGEALQRSDGPAAAVAAAGRPEKLGDEDRVVGMWASTNGAGSPYRRLSLACALNALLLLSVGLSSSLPLPVLQGWSAPLATIVPLAALFGCALYVSAFAAVRAFYGRRMRSLVPNLSVVVPDHEGNLKGHPCHLYYTIPYDATSRDVKIQGFIRGKFTYTSVHAYGWHSLPVANGQFRYDETLFPDDSASAKDRFTVFLTTRPTFEPGVNEIDVSQEPTGICLVRLIYPEDQCEVLRCTPSVVDVARGERERFSTSNPNVKAKNV